LLVNTAFLLLGSNIEPRFDFLSISIDRIKLDIGNIVRKSSIYESEPVGFESSNLFLNQVVVVETSLSASCLLENILAIEKDLGRERVKGKYTSRTIDIDILYYNSDIIKSKELIVPHPRMHQRLFTLLPLVEIEAEMVHPVLGKDHNSLLDECIDNCKVRKI
jgi:2-amino-4-hydroxy-6-hydroxymethyldihydropteridine diphosphokinase